MSFRFTYLFCSVVLLLLPAFSVAQKTETPLTRAIVKKDLTAVDSLLRMGADPMEYVYTYAPYKEKRVAWRDTLYQVFEWRTYPMLLAVKSGELPLVKLLHEYGASVNLGSRCLRDTMRKRHIGYGEYSPLDRANKLGYTEMTAFLENHGAVTMKEQCDRGRRIKFLLLSTDESPDSLRMVDSLMDAYGDGVAFCGAYGYRDITARAFYYNIPKIYKYLIEVREVSLEDGRFYETHAGWHHVRSDISDEYDYQINVFLGNWTTVELVEYYMRFKSVDRETLEFYMRYMSKKNVRKELQKYYKLKFRLEDKNPKGWRRKCIEQRMQKYREQLWIREFKPHHQF